MFWIHYQERFRKFTLFPIRNVETELPGSNTAKERLTGIYKTDYKTIYNFCADDSCAEINFMLYSIKYDMG